MTFPSHVRRSTVALTALALLALTLMAALAHSWLEVTTAELRADSGWPTARLTRALGLTDLALFTDARYARHPSQADLFTPFQDAPLALEHFPSGALLSPPRHFGDTGGFAPSALEESGS